jgi:hypothetical protein
MGGALDRRPSCRGGACQTGVPYLAHALVRGHDRHVHIESCGNHGHAPGLGHGNRGLARGSDPGHGHSRLRVRVVDPHSHDGVEQTWSLGHTSGETAPCAFGSWSSLRPRTTP